MDLWTKQQQTAWSECETHNRVQLWKHGGRRESVLGWRPDYLWTEIWKDMSEAAQRKEKQTCAIKKPKLDNARRLRGIYFIDPADAEFKETIKKTRGES